jgi:hypothetical protein
MLPTPALDAALAARVQRRARSALREHGLTPAERVVPTLLLAAGLFYLGASIERLVAIFGG